ncbi:bifunctional adenosylcobinamide kinase/adenosylcobinamide-phosphate guanylyltransferase [Vibrio sp. JPW-9-11-11]|uniref:bifunctional adenosylcobinamide kinase/adenosylcobinamide-phosphate guanylyltransferase n=1 Tax=Vibrio sp. JPW-9-11-11 TaxID=1416532 RepID=UPI001593F1BF|nr:bifunctional adenosylcobinamide kinase/adenosylcobinamide-phosphate guanylyltransferase [Vibrio sp. JPW-9-11-11]NVD06564.1 bifunctional adenosylcobinamide kinase/adenosylcobinamide-phosphate guanylyltransferase [Vibrio sp. JPW-9-11-11]
MSIQLILGGARSGKSSRAEAEVRQLSQGGTKHYVATALAFDREMEARIEKHRQSRGLDWTEHECPRHLAETIAQFGPQDVVLIDCLTLWLNNVIYNQGQTLDELEIEAEVVRLVEALAASQASIVLVSNEVGLGVVPLGEVSRLFVDHAGWMNQAVARIADKVTLVSAGLPLVLKGG